MGLFVWICLILGIHLLLDFFSFRYFWKYRKIIDCHTGMNIAMTVGGLMSILIGIALISLFPTHYTLTTLIAMGAGMLIGLLFGLVGDLQAVIAGISCGLMNGLMSPMVAAMVPQPFQLLIMVAIIQALLLGLLCFSIQVLKNKGAN